jgi:hypothetical protein
MARQHLNDHELLAAFFNPHAVADSDPRSELNAPLEEFASQRSVHDPSMEFQHCAAMTQTQDQAMRGW